MVTQRMAIGLTGINLLLLVLLLSQGLMTTAQAQAIPDVLRAHGLEIVDDHGRVRASISIYDDDPKPPNNYPPVVVFRLHDRAGKPTVKIDTHEAGGGKPKGSGLGLLGDSDVTQAFIGTDGPVAKVQLTNGGQRERIMTP